MKDTREVVDLLASAQVIKDEKTPFLAAVRTENGTFWEL